MDFSIEGRPTRFSLPQFPCFSVYDYTLPLTLYNTEARIQEILDPQFERPLQVLPHGVGGNPP